MNETIDKNKEMFKMLAKQDCDFALKDEGVIAIIEKATEDNNKWEFIHNLYTWGYMQGLKAKK